MKAAGSFAPIDVTRLDILQAKQVELASLVLRGSVKRFARSPERFVLCFSGALERMGGETSQLALARCVIRGVLGRERSRGRTVEKWRAKTKFCSTYKIHCYG